MTKKSLGYVQLEWVCTNCGTKNPAPEKICSSCGTPQPEDIEFQQAAHEELITDEAEIARAQAGPDIHCHYCGARNPADAKTCSQCGADLAEGTARSSGQILGAYRHGPAEKITCPNCGTPNEADAPKCVNCGAGLAQAAQPVVHPRPTAEPAKLTATKTGRSGLIGPIIGIGILLLIVAACITFFVLSSRTEDITGRVQSASWTRNVTIEELRPVTYETWQDELPAGAVVGTCTQKFHHVQDEPAPNAQEVCGTPYTVDTGTGFGEVVQDCEYRVFEDWCEYDVDEWQQVDVITVSGDDYNPRWPALNLLSEQRESSRDESYEIVFSTEQGTYTFQTRNPNLFAQVQNGSQWILKVNSFNAVTGIEPAR